ncbi:hypothetical protein SAMN06298216_3819 [Spirosomataceae bacterium TFI 002]|nr:hypothetical protein SAMN06298216_3819 [Spirosomataceae bacterium TFI 002]
MKTILQALCLVSLLGLGSAYSQDVTHTITCELTNIAEIRFKPGATNVTNYEFSTIDDYENNKASNNGANLQVACNKDWTVNVRAGSSTFSYVGTHTDPSMPSTVLKVRNLPSSRISLTETDTQIATGAPGDFTSNEVKLRYIAVPGYDYPEGVYTIDVVYTLTNG